MRLYSSQRVKEIVELLNCGNGFGRALTVFLTDTLDFLLKFGGEHQIFGSYACKSINFVSSANKDSFALVRPVEVAGEIFAEISH